MGRLREFGAFDAPEASVGRLLANPRRVGRRYQQPAADADRTLGTGRGDPERLYIYGAWMKPSLFQRAVSWAQNNLKWAITVCLILLPCITVAVAVGTACGTGNCGNSRTSSRSEILGPEIPRPPSYPQLPQPASPQWSPEIPSMPPLPPAALRPAAQLPFLVAPVSYPLIPLPPTYPPSPTPEPLPLPPLTAYPPPNPTLPTYPLIPLPPGAATTAAAAAFAAPPQGPPSPPRRLRTWPAEMPLPPWPPYVLPGHHQPQDIPCLSPCGTEPAAAAAAGGAQQQQQERDLLGSYAEPTGFLKE